ncbi:hypothetical protein E2562_002576 [Oryza meyeriana var. granulata]|uniref:Uncharacterized protein n=1 Tax=Oryza meyeriana var. granulata TaxID=110450 RepID=A0A6G1F2V1_9ORYZ|nr:hypothetical protein E2562_002576 [Oryza meyeriana var. granulata]
MEAVRRGRYFVVLCMAAAAVLACSAGVAVPAAAAVAQELQRGFSAAHDGSYSQFEPVLSDPTGVFAVSFLRVNSTMLDLARPAGLAAGGSRRGRRGVRTRRRRQRHHPAQTMDNQTRAETAMNVEGSGRRSVLELAVVASSNSAMRFLMCLMRWAMALEL